MVKPYISSYYLYIRRVTLQKEFCDRLKDLFYLNLYPVESKIWPIQIVNPVSAPKRWK